jgi:metal-responsive CopG/Arc/MetJ family transcriptional regulator
MAKAKLAITLDTELLDDIDELIAADHFANRSQAIEAAVAEKLARLARTRLAREVSKLDPRAEKALAEEGFSADAGSWPEY